jgi:ABC-type transport system substrate-binding protein
MKALRTALLASVFALPFASPALYAATPDNMLVVAQNIDDIISLDPAQAYEFTAGELLTNIYDRLVQYDAEDPTVLPAASPKAGTSTPRTRPSPSSSATRPSIPATRCAART